MTIAPRRTEIILFLELTLATFYDLWYSDSNAGGATPPTETNLNQKRPLKHTPPAPLFPNISYANHTPNKVTVWRLDFV